jgi:hypothetical protein
MEEKRIIEALVHLGINQQWLLTGKGDIQINSINNNSGIAGVNGNGNQIHQETKSQEDGSNKQQSNVCKGIKFYLGIFGVIVVCAFIFWFLAVISYKYFGFALSPDNVVVTFVGILATFVVVSNYMQVLEIKKEFETKISGMESKYEKDINEVKVTTTAQVSSIDNKLNSIYEMHVKIIRAMEYFETGKLHLENNISVSLSFYINSLELLNCVREDEITNIVMEAIDRLRKMAVEDHKRLGENQIRLSHGDKIKYIKTLSESKHKLSANLVKWIKNTPESELTNIIECASETINKNAQTANVG